MKKKDYSNRINQLLYEEKFFGVLVFKKYANFWSSFLKHKAWNYDGWIYVSSLGSAYNTAMYLYILYSIYTWKIWFEFWYSCLDLRRVT